MQKDLFEFVSIDSIIVKPGGGKYHKNESRNFWLTRW